MKTYKLIPVFDNGQHATKDEWHIFQVDEVFEDGKHIAKGKKIIRGTTPELKKQLGNHTFVSWWQRVDLTTGKISEVDN